MSHRTVSATERHAEEYRALNEAAAAFDLER